MKDENQPARVNGQQLSLAKTRSRRSRQRTTKMRDRRYRSWLQSRCADDHPLAPATDLSMSACRSRSRQQDRRASADRALCSLRRRARVRRPRLRCAADVAVVESADLGQGKDPSLRGWLNGTRLGSILLQCEMRAGAVVVAEVAAQTTTKVSLIQDDHVVEKLA